MCNLSESEILAIATEVPKKVGEQVTHFRKLKNLSQTELGKIVGKDRQYIYKIEKAKVTPNIATLAIITAALDISLSKLFEKVHI